MFFSFFKKKSSCAKSTMDCTNVCLGLLLMDLPSLKTKNNSPKQQPINIQISDTPIATVGWCIWHPNQFLLMVAAVFSVSPYLWWEGCQIYCWVFFFYCMPLHVFSIMCVEQWCATFQDLLMLMNRTTHSLQATTKAKLACVVGWRAPESNSYHHHKQGGHVQQSSGHRWTLDGCLGLADVGVKGWAAHLLINTKLGSLDVTSPLQGDPGQRRWLAGEMQLLCVCG